MNTLARYCVIIGGATLGQAALAAPTAQPPMDKFNEAFYRCDNGGGFLISYDSITPKAATMTTSNGNDKHLLMRTRVAPGVEFSGENVKFWTDGQTVVVDGTREPFLNCKMKTE